MCNAVTWKIINFQHLLGSKCGLKSMNCALLNTNSFIYLFHFLVWRRDESHFRRNCSQITWHVQHNHIYILHVFLHPISCFGLEKNIVIMFVKIFCNSFDVTNLGLTFKEKAFAKMHKVLFGILHLFLLP